MQLFFTFTYSLFWYIFLFWCIYDVRLAIGTCFFHTHINPHECEKEKKEEEKSGEKIRKVKKKCILFLKDHFYIRTLRIRSSA